jgi:ectoine hydroxylase-related dioxygenase (phytanoyl-CoA dioxygenase family)
MLTPQQLAHFETFGYVVLRQAFAPDEINAISRAFDSVLDEDRGGQAFSGEKRQAVLGVIERRPVLSQLAESDLVYEMMEQLLGPGFVWVGSDGNLYVGDTGWHPDSIHPSYRRIKVAFYLDPVARDTGCLRVVPGSHRSPLHDELKALQTTKAGEPTVFGVAPRDLPCVPLDSQPGDVVAFDQRTWHAAFGGKTGRRMFTLNFAAPPTTAEHEAILRQSYAGNLQAVREMQFTQTGRVYDEAFLHSDRPRIRSMTHKLVEYGFQ